MFEIKHRHTGAVVYRSEAATTLREAVVEAVAARAYLAGAYLAGAYLAGAYLTRAYLTGADLYGAYLAGAYLTGAYLAGADLTGAYLTGAYLAGAYLTGAYLAGADLTGAELAGADLYGADLTDTVLAPGLPTNKHGDFGEVDGECVGYRTRRSIHCGGAVYEDGQEYRADVFSVCPVTACHPGLYCYPAVGEVRLGYPREEIIEVRFRRDDLHAAGGKYRVRAFRVVGQAEEGS